MGRYFSVIVCGYLFLVLFRVAVFLINNHKSFIDFFSGKDKSLSGFFELIDYKYLLLGIKTEENSGRSNNARCIKTEATVIDKKVNKTEFYDEYGKLVTKKSFDLKVKFYVGDESFVSFVHTDRYDDKVKIFYNVDNPHEIYLQDDPELVMENKKNNFSNAVSTSLYVGIVVIVLLFYMLGNKS